MSSRSRPTRGPSIRCGIGAAPVRSVRTARSSDSGRAPDRGGGHDAALVALSRLELRVAGSAALRWPDATFDKAFLVHTLYFRSEPEKDLRELRRVLKPAGALILGFRESSSDIVPSFPAPIH